MKKLVHKIRLTAFFFSFSFFETASKLSKKKARAQVCETVRTVRHTHLVFSCTLNGFCTEKTTKMLVGRPPFFLLLPLHTSTQSSKFRKKVYKIFLKSLFILRKKNLKFQIFLSNYPFLEFQLTVPISGRSQETMGFGGKVQT